MDMQMGANRSLAINQEPATVFKKSLPTPLLKHTLKQKLLGCSSHVNLTHLWVVTLQMRPPMRVGGGRDMQQERWGYHE